MFVFLLKMKGCFPIYNIDVFRIFWYVRWYKFLSPSRHRLGWPRVFKKIRFLGLFYIYFSAIVTSDYFPFSVMYNNSWAFQTLFQSRNWTIITKFSVHFIESTVYLWTDKVPSSSTYYFVLTEEDNYINLRFTEDNLVGSCTKTKSYTFFINILSQIDFGKCFFV